MRRSAGLSLLALLGVAALGIVTARAVLPPLAAAWARAANPFALVQRGILPSPVILERVQRLERLETCRYQGEVVVRGETSSIVPVWLAGDRILFVGRGEAVAGIDLGRLRPSDIRAAGSRVTLRLPAAEILHTRLDNRASEVHDRQTGFLTGPDAQLETRVRVEAEDRIRRAAVESGILKTARENARATLVQHLRGLGFRDVSIL